MKKKFPPILIPAAFLVLSCAGAPEPGPVEPVETTLPWEAPVPQEAPLPKETTAAPADEAPLPAESSLPSEAGAVDEPDIPAALPEGALLRKGIDGFVFTPEPYNPRAAAPGVGGITRERRDRASALGAVEKARLTKAFQDAYVDGLLRNQALAGVLGGDQVHGWPETNPLSWAQNWQTSRPRSNSWGLPSLVLAVVSAMLDAAPDSGSGRVFTVQGAVLDFYGRGAGIHGANGNVGFGSPRGEEFLYRGNLAQRFDYGIIVIDASGESGKGAFIAEPPPSDEIEIPEGTVESIDFPSKEIKAAFFDAWKIATDSGWGRGRILVPDGKMAHIAAQAYDGDPAVFDGIDARGFYLLTFNRASSAIILLDAPGLPNHARFIGAPFMELLTEGLPVAGTEPPARAPRAESGTAAVDKLLDGLAVYGLPLTDPLYRRNGAGIWVTTQRFVKGWLEFSAAP